MTQSKSKLSTKQRSGFLLTGSIIALLIAFSPYIFYLYEIFPDGPVWENSLFTYESKYYLNVMTAMWTYLGKITPLFLLLIWFFTCKHWWYHVILVPTIMYSYQLLTAVYQDSADKFLDDGDLLYLAPFFIIIVSIVYLVRIKIFDKIYGIDLSEIEETNISVFSSMSEKDQKEIDDMKNSADTDEDYYAKL
ncbi:hypothetical protein [Zunongwangia sp. HGR-M22]|uniref:hypothetical protein n=1 Tax=Zunongwangia sp. HGR-M22 TaxID=3015168 RepID=UPI0022DE14D9|nr:hypothetical protein [Zunongwangia sp. HGR-M22]WBL24374.1 hypothetical protein PBT91_10660 [Zunongwangia sp. HGR-M22]